MTATDPTPTYLDASASVDDRVADLLALMTLDEKLAQLGSAWVFQIAGADGLDAERAEPVLRHGIGHITRISGASSLGAAAAAALANEIQQHLVDHTRLGIPAIVHEEICSGFMAREATIFPQALGVAGTFRPEHNRAIADAIRLQMRSMGAHQGLSPVLDVCRDPRWGRCEESYGEDPQLVTAMGNAFIEGLQTADLRDGVVATAKHFVGYGASEGGLNWAPAHLPERELRDVYLRPFESAVRDSGLASVMNGYHEIDGLPCGANRWLLTDLLRGEWGFDGTVVSDYFTVRQLHDYHRVTADLPTAAAVGLHAGIDVELPGTDCYDEPLRDALAAGQLETRRCRPCGRTRARDEVPAGSVRAAVRRPGPDRRPPPLRRADRTGADDRRRQPGPAQERRRSAARRARVHRGDRTQCRVERATCSATTATSRTSSR